MSSLSAVAKFSAQLLRPSFYQSQFTQFVDNLRIVASKNAATPLFYAIGVTGVIGYSIKFFIVERK